MIYLGYILLAMLGGRFLVVLTNFLSRPFLPEANENGDEPLVSILIPARNEECTISLILSDLQQCGYSNLEVIVCNDHSTDGTAKVLSDFQYKYPQLSFFESVPLTEGWMGKNFACHQLAEKANGTYLLFLDADVRIMPGVISKMVSYASSRNLALLSFFPQQIIGSIGEWCTIPLMNWVLLSYLPLPLVRWERGETLSAANGQTMFFDAAEYKKHRWHEQVKGANVEDILIARLVKKNNLKLEVLLGNNDVLCRMYENYLDAVKGFSRNIHQWFNGNRVWMLFFVVVSWVRIPLLIAIFPSIVALIALFVVFMMKWLVAVMSNQSVVKNYVYHFFQLLALTIIAARNLTGAKKGRLEWKGRVYNTHN
jgi:chlorobactene glucosyltransferase